MGAAAQQERRWVEVGRDDGLGDEAKEVDGDKHDCACDREAEEGVIDCGGEPEAAEAVAVMAGGALVEVCFIGGGETPLLEAALVDEAGGALADAGGDEAAELRVWGVGWGDGLQADATDVVLRVGGWGWGGCGGGGCEGTEGVVDGGCGGGHGSCMRSRFSACIAEIEGCVEARFEGLSLEAGEREREEVLLMLINCLLLHKSSGPVRSASGKRKGRNGRKRKEKAGVLPLLSQSLDVMSGCNRYHSRGEEEMQIP